jgi:hypothetical protein
MPPQCRLQMAGLKYTHPMQCLRDTVATEGLRGLTRGLGATLAREVPGNAVFFTMYEALRRTLPGRPPRDRDPDAPVSFLEVAEDATSAIVCGGLAGMTVSDPACSMAPWAWTCGPAGDQSRTQDSL